MLPNVVLFQGVDSIGNTGLWETDGTATGTFELTGIAGTFSTGLYPGSLAPLNANEVLFNGVDKGGLVGLWETDGTAAGTHELTGIVGAAKTAAGLYPSEFTTYKGKVLFSGYDSTSSVGLWVTDGTVAGTHELAVAGAATPGEFYGPPGLSPAYFTIYDGDVFFAGDDDSGSIGLWETDGTASGTHELNGIGGAATIGQSIGAPGLSPAYLTVFNGEMLFSGDDAHGQLGLWETDGSVAGTHELTGIAGAPTTGKGLNPSDLTVFDGQVVFNGRNSSGQLGLWVTDGTVAGTHELTGITGASTTGTGLNPSDFTVINGQVLFSGVDSSGLLGLWETDGTVAGTHELTGIGGAQTKGLGFDPTNLTFYNSEALFSGYDSTGKVGLWTTDGTAAGTHELTGVVGASTSGLAPSDLTAVAPTVAARPVLTAGASVSYIAGAAPVTLDAGLTLTDAAAASLSTATVSISAGFAQGDMLSVGSPQTGITSAYNAATGVLTLSGAASLAAYKTELDSITYASANATTSSRTISWSVNDGVNASNPVTSNVSVSRLPPVLTAGAGVSYIAGAAPVTLDAGLTLTDAAAASLSTATVSISAGFAQGDMLSVGSPQTGITSAYNAATGVLTLSGAASLAAYKTELDSITYASANATTSSRTISWSVNDGVNASNPVTSNVSVSRLPPVLTAGAGVSYIAGAAPVTLDAGLTLTDAAAASLSTATVSISAGFAQGDMLSVGSPQTGITSAYNAATGVLTLSGAASLAAYKTELDSITYASANATTSSRTISWSVNDGVNASNPVTSNVSATAAETSSNVPGPNLNIMLQSIGGQLALWTVNGSRLSAAELLGPNPGPDWLEMGTGAFFSGDASDILFQNRNGAVALWQLQNDAVVSSRLVANPGPNWRVKGTGDFNNDDMSDLVLQNANGAVAIWDMNGDQIGQSSIIANPGANWHVEATGDFNNDGKSDIVLQNANGSVAIWEMNGDQISQSSVIANPGPNWHVEATGDFNNDGKSDIVLQNANGSVAIWEMNGDQISQSSVIANPGPNLHVVSAGGGSDILFQNTNGQVSIWDMDGTHLVGGRAVSADPGSSWRAVGLA